MIGLESGSGTNPTLEEKITQCVMDKFADGTVEKLIQAAIEDAVKKGLEDIFCYRGEGKKLIEEKLSKVIVPAIERHDFNQYLVKLDEVLTSIVNQTTLADNKKILDNFKECMTEPDKKEIKLSEIFAKYCESVAKNVNTDKLEVYADFENPYYQQVSTSMEVEHVDKGWFTSRFQDCYVNFKCEEDSSLNCQLKLYKNVDADRWTILASLHGVELTSLRNMTDFEVFLSIIQRSYTAIIMDTERESDDIDPEEEPELNYR